MQKLTLLQNSFTERMNLTINGRFFLREDRVGVLTEAATKPKQRVLILCNDLLLLAKKDWRERYQLVDKADVSDIFLIDVKTESTQSLVEMRMNETTYLLMMSSKQQKQAWLDEWRQLTTVKIPTKSVDSAVESPFAMVEHGAASKQPVQPIAIGVTPPSLEHIHGRSSSQETTSSSTQQQQQQQQAAESAELMRENDYFKQRLSLLEKEIYRRDNERSGLQNDTVKYHQNSLKMQEEILLIQSELKAEKSKVESLTGENDRLRNHVTSLESKNKELLGMLKRRDIEIHTLKTSKGTSPQPSSPTLKPKSPNPMYAHVQSNYSRDRLFGASTSDLKLQSYSNLGASELRLEPGSPSAGSSNRTSEMAKENESLKATVTRLQTDDSELKRRIDMLRIENDLLKQKLFALQPSTGSLKPAASQHHPMSKLRSDNNKAWRSQNIDDEMRKSMHTLPSEADGNLTTEAAKNKVLLQNVQDLTQRCRALEEERNIAERARSQLQQELSQARLRLDQQQQQKIATDLSVQTQLRVDLQKSNPDVRQKSSTDLRSKVESKSTADLRSAHLKLEMELHVKEKESEEARKEAEQLRQQIGRMKEDLIQLSSSTERTQSDSDQTDARHQREVKQLRDEIRSLQGRLSDKEEELARRRDQMVRISNTVDRSTESVLLGQTRHSPQSITTSSKLLIRDSSVDNRVEGILEDLQEELQATQDECGRLKSKLTDSESERKGKATELLLHNRALASHAKDLEEHCEKARIELKRLFKEEELNRELKSKLQLCATEMRKMEENIRELGGTVQELERENGSLKTQLREATNVGKVLKSTEEELRRIKSDLKQSKRNLDTKDFDVSELKLELATTKEKLEGMRAAEEAEKSSHWKEKMNHLLRTRQDECKDLTHRLSQMEQDKNQEIDQLKSTILHLENTAKEFETTLIQMDTAMRSKRRPSVAQLWEARDDRRESTLDAAPKNYLEKKLAKIQENTKTLEGDLAIRNAALTRLAMLMGIEVDFSKCFDREQIQAVENVLELIQKLQTEHQALQVDVHSVMEEFNRLRKAHEDLKVNVSIEMEMQKNRFQNNQKQHDTEIEKFFRERIQILEASLQRFEKNNFELTERYQIAMSEREALRAQCSVLNSRLDHCIMVNAQLEETGRVSQQQLDEARRELKQFQEKNQDLIQRLQNAEQGKDSLDDAFVKYFEKSKKEAEDHAAQLAELHEELQTMQRWKEEVHVYIRDLEYQVEQTRNRLENAELALRRSLEESAQLRKDMNDRNKFWPRKDYDHVHRQLESTRHDLKDSKLEKEQLERQLETVRGDSKEWQERCKEAQQHAQDRANETQQVRKSMDEYKSMIKDLDEHYSHSILSRERDIETLHREFTLFSRDRRTEREVDHVRKALGTVGSKEAPRQLPAVPSILTSGVSRSAVTNDQLLGAILQGAAQGQLSVSISPTRESRERGGRHFEL